MRIFFIDSASLRVLGIRAFVAIATAVAFSGVHAQQSADRAKAHAVSAAANKEAKASDSKSQSGPAASQIATQPTVTSSAAPASTPAVTSGNSHSDTKPEQATKETTDAVIARWTIILGYATGASALVAFLQFLLLARGTKDTKNAAKASQRSALISELALTKLERPYVLVTITKPGLAYRDLGGTKEVAPGTQELNLINFGRSPALLTEFVHDWFSTVKPDEKPTLRALGTWNQTLFPYGTFSAMGDPHWEKRQLEVGSYGRALALGAYEAWVVGHVCYSDLLGNEYVTGFAFKFDVRRNEFIRTGGEEFNYGKQTKRVTGSEATPPPSAWRKLQWLVGSRH